MRLGALEGLCTGDRAASKGETARQWMVGEVVRIRLREWTI